MRAYMIAVTLAAFALVIPTSAWGQFNRSGSSLGSSSMKANSAGSSMFGNRFGQSTSSRSGSNSLTAGASSTRTGLGGTSSDQLLRSARGAGNFVGADANDNRNFLGFTDANSRTGLNRQNSLRRSTSTSNVNRAQRNSYGTGRSGRSTETVRPTIEVGFEHTSRPADTFVPKLTTRLTKSPNLRFLKPVQMTVENGKVVLQGAVRSEHERALAEQFVLQEPGVHEVENRLTVAESTSTSSAPESGNP